MRLVVYTDSVFSEEAGVVYEMQSFSLFLGALADEIEGMTIVARLDPQAGATRYPLPRSVRFVALPHYSTMTRAAAVMSSLARSLYRFWRALDDADCVWLMGPYPHAVAFAAIAALRRRRVVLGVRQDFPTYVRHRRPRRRWMHLAADLLEQTWRVIARRCDVVAVGPELARRYSGAKRVLEISVSLVSAQDIAEGERALVERSYDGELRVLSVGRLDEEKNPLLLADVLANLRDGDSRWRLVVCGEGTLEGALAQRLEQRGLADAADLSGYVQLDQGLMELYRSSHALLHVSWTEGVPQVLSEAFAARLPVVATAVGGVAEAVGEAALLIAPGDPSAAADALRRIADDQWLRAQLVNAGVERVRSRTLESEAARVAAFIRGRTGSRTR